MPTALTKTVARLRRIAGWAAVAECSDRDLLARFATDGDEDAFEALVRRHGPLVFGVCRRVLANAHDAEDAFQATFLVLARKAGQLAWHESVKNWLHGVASRVALKARAQRQRRRVKEQTAPPPAAAPESPWEDLRGVLDEELARLPAHYRAPLLLCYLEGKTRDEAAEELGWSPGSVKGRLERGRDILRDRLARRGLPLSAVLCASLLCASATAAVPASLNAATVAAGVSFVTGSVLSPAAATVAATKLAQGVLTAMLIAKIKTSIIAVLVFAVLGVGSGALIQNAVAGREPSVPEFLWAQGKDPDRKQEGERKKDGDGAKDGAKDVQRDAGKDEVRGTVKSIDLAKGVITITGSGEANPGDQTFNLASKDVKVVFVPMETPGKLADLTPKTIVFLKLNDLGDVSGIRAQGPTVIGILREVDAAKKKIVMNEPRKDQQTFTVAADATLRVGGKATKLDELRPGTRVTVILSLDKSTVVYLSAPISRRDDARDPAPAPKEGVRKDGDRKDDVRRDGARDGEARADGLGIVVAVNADKNSLEVLFGGNDDPTIRTFDLPKDAKITFRSDAGVRDLPLAELAKATKVAVFFGADKKTVARLEAQAPQVRTVLQAIDAAKRKLNFEGTTLDIAESARITLAGKNLPLADLDKGTRVVLQLNPQRTQVLSIQVIRGDGER